MEKEQNKNMPSSNDRSFVKERMTDEGMKPMFFAANPIPGASAAGIEADVKAFLGYMKEQNAQEPFVAHWRRKCE